MKEYAIKETKKYTTWRIYKRLIKRHGKISSYVIVNLSVAHDRRSFYFTRITPGAWAAANFENYHFKLTKNNVLVTHKLTPDGVINNTISSIRYIGRLFSLTRPFSKYTQRKINRILKRVFPEIKIKDDTIDFLMSRLYDHSVLYNEFKDHLDLCHNIRKHIAKSKTIKELSHKCVGLRGKKLIKILATNPEFIKTLAQLSKIKKFISHGVMNNVIDYYVDNQPYCSMHIHEEMKRLLEFKPAWINDITDRKKQYLMGDICRLMGNLEEYEFSEDDFKGSINDVHDRLTIILKKQKQKNYPCDEYFPPIVEDNFMICLPKDTHEIISWGHIMGHCIGGYTKSHRTGFEIVGAVVKDNEMIANFSMNKSGEKYKIIQLLGKHNTHLPIEDFFKVIDMLEKNDILDEQDYTKIWGFTHAKAAVV